MKHAKEAILRSTQSPPIFWSTQSTSFHEAFQARHTSITRARKARQNAKHIKHAAKHASTQAVIYQTPKFAFIHNPQLNQNFWEKLV